MTTRTAARAGLWAGALLVALQCGLPSAAACTEAPHDPFTDLDPLEAPILPEPRTGWLFVLPVAAYAPETGFSFGASAAYQRQFSRQPGARPSTFLPVVLLTVKNQLLVGLLTDAWLAADAWHLTANAGYRKFPTLFHGIGDDTSAAQEERYTDLSADLELELARRISGPLFVGGILDANHTRLRDLETGGLLASGTVPGAGGGSLWGLGLSLAWDSRDAVQYPTRGWNQRLSVTRYLDVLGGDYRYTWTEAMVSRYWPLGDDQVLAANLHGTFKAGGVVPFYRLSPMGLRGYSEERHRERHVVRGQVELRSGLWGRLGGVVFAGLGEMAAGTDRLRLDEVRPMLGAGLRFNVGGAQRVNLAVDVGFGEDQSGVYLRFGEAF